MKIQANGITYFVNIHQDDGKKPVLLLLHGFMGSGYVFENVAEKMKSCCNPVTVDLLGHGKTGHAPSPERFKTKQQVEDLAAIIEKISRKPIYLHGYSMGGRLALHYALSKPESLKGLILESVNPGITTKKERIQRKLLDEQRANHIEKNFHSFLDKWSKQPLFKNSKALKDDLKYYIKIQRQQNPQQMAYSLRGFGTGQMPPANEKLRELEMPVLLLVGENDKKYCNIATEINPKIPISTLKIIPDAGHRIHLDQSEHLCKILNNFID